MIKIYQKQPIQAEQFDGTQKMVNKYHISVYNENIDKYGGLGDWTPNEYTFNGTYIDVGDWIIECSGNIRLIMTNNEFKKDYAELPVIPKSWANAIEEYRDRFGSAKGLNELITDMNVPWKLGVLETVTAIPEVILGVFRSKTDVLARAWLDGYEIDNKS